MRYRTHPYVQSSGERVRAGFTLLELLVVLALMAVLFGLGLPALKNMIDREKLLGAAREISVVMRNARLEAIKGSGATTVAVDIDPSTRTILSFVDDDDDAVLDAGERVLSYSTLTAGVYFKAPTGSGIDDVVDGLERTGTTGVARFNADGSVDAVGAFRYADQRGNFLEVRVDPRSVARVKIRKWDGTDWFSRDESPGPWYWH